MLMPPWTKVLVDFGARWCGILRPEMTMRDRLNLGMVVAVLLLAAGSARAAGGEVRIAVMEFGNTSADHDLDSLGKGLQSMVTTDLAQVSSLKLVERARLQDIQSELKLGKSGSVDPKTAAKVGKLAGASHLVSGTFTVVGDKMRLDGRIFAVADGSIVLAEAIEGDKDAFFELEKTLVKKIVDTVGIKLQSKERGAIAKFHTTDFEAFRNFSQGVALFDEKKYDEAIAALRSAQSRDQDFKLATVTLAEYQGIIAGLKARADELQSSSIELGNLERQKEARGEAEVLKKLHEIAGRKSPKDQLDRLAALHLLAVAYGNISSEPDDLYKIQGLEDRFALQRIADVMVQSYWVEASAIFPRVIAVVRTHVGVDPPKTVAAVDAALAETRKQLERYATFSYGCIRSDVREVQILCNLQWRGLRDDPLNEFPLRLHLDGRQTVELHQRFYDWGVKLGAPAEWRAQWIANLADDYRNVGDFGRSTALFTQLAGQLHDADKVREVTEQIELNRTVAEALAHSPDKELMREYLANGSHTAWNRRTAADLASRIDYWKGDPSRKALLRDVAMYRPFPESGRWGGGNKDTFVYVGDQPVWQVQAGQFVLGTGRRSDPRRAESIRYYPDSEDQSTADNLLLVEGVPRRDVHLRFDADFTAGADFWPFRGDSDSYKPDGKGRRPDVGFLFGATNVNSDYTKDPKTNQDVPVRPFHAFAVILGADGVRLVELTEQAEGHNLTEGVARRGKALVKKELGQKAVDLRGAKTLATGFEVAGDTVTATVNGNAYSFPIPKDHQGFYGVYLTGAGYAEVRGLKTAQK